MMFFFPYLLVMVAITGAYVLVHTAFCFVSVALETAAGLDKWDWKFGLFADWIGQALHLLWLIFLSLFPVIVVLHCLPLASATVSTARNILVPSALFCLLFPIFLLSSYSANSLWVLFHFEVIQRMARRLPTVLGFYVLSAPVCLAGGAALYATLVGWRFYALPVLATVLLIYARLIGRMARVLGRVRFSNKKTRGDSALGRPGAGRSPLAGPQLGVSEGTGPAEEKEAEDSSPGPMGCARGKGAS